MDSEKKAFLKNFIWNSLGTGINSFNSLFFLIIVTRVNDIQTAGIFSIGYATATILYTLAMYSGRLCQVTDIEGKIKDKDYIAQRAFTCIIMLIGAAVFLGIQQYTGFKTMVFALLAIFKGIEAFSDILYGVMQKNDILYKSGQSLTIKGFVGIALFLIVDLITKDIRWACFAVILINLLVLVVYDYFIVTRKLIDHKSKISKANIVKILKSEFFVFVNSFAGIYILNAPKYAIDSYLTDDIQAIYGYIMMPATVMTLFTQFIVMPFLGKLKDMYERKELKAIDSVTFKIKLIVVAFGAFAVLAAFLLGPEFLGLIYGLDLTMYRMNLCVIIGSYIFYAISYINLVTLTTIRHTFIQFVIYVASMVIAFIGSNTLVGFLNLGINGATFSCTTTLAIQFVLYTIATRIIMYKENKKLANS
ncbi:MAG: lipopolysaccharide biosynthesis protein [Clostridia bacterium]|nr:lipopolysaccharide biosynthesis protein [Clostridia bacterium]